MKEKASRAMEAALSVLRENSEIFKDKFQASNSEHNFYPVSENVEWTTGFCTGQYWLAYEMTGEDVFRKTALLHVDSFLERIDKKIDVNHHDMGFLYTPSCVAAYKLIGSEKGKEAALKAADHLMSRFQEKGQFLQAWGELGAVENYRLIIDCLLNLPLLYWAGEVTGDDRYGDVALRHTRTSLKNLIREDNSTYHTFFFDKETGEPTYGVTHQGYRDGSAWARGQAWGIYGTALSYRYTTDKECIDLFCKVTDFFIDKLPQDMIPYWDLEFTEKDNEPKDSSAAAIAVCGMLEMCYYMEEDKAAYYRSVAEKILVSLIENYSVKDTKISNGLLLHGVYAKNSPYNPIPEDRGVDECNTWGDYFYIEALVRVLKDWNIYW